MKIAFFETDAHEKTILERGLKGHTLLFFNRPLTAKDLSKIKDVDILSIAIYSKIDKTIITKLPNLKYLSTRSTGFDHIDLEACKQHQVAVSNVPYYGANTVAEHAFALLLSLSRKITYAHDRVRKKNFSIQGLKGFDLKGKTLGVIGAGNIGINTIKIAKGFGMSVVSCERHPDPARAKEIGFVCMPLPEILKRADIISLHIPYTKETHHMIGKKEFALMKKGSLLINTSRGGIIDTKALWATLQSGKLGGVGLDVIEGEELLKGHPRLHNHHTKTLVNTAHKVITHPSVIYTPHIAYYTQEALDRISQTTVKNIQSFLKKKPENLL